MNSRLSTIVAGGLVGILLLAVTGIIVLAVLGQPTPGVLDNLASGALGALAALLARVGGDTQPVHVTNSVTDPVPVDAGHLDALTILGGIVIVTAGIVLATLLLRAWP